MSSPKLQLALCLLPMVCTPALARQPNVVVILADDQGWGDLGVNGNENLATPNIDSLARDGATLKYFYVCQVCAPTRAEFLTGRYYPRTGVSGVSRGLERMNASETTIADCFRAAGYATGAFGKWHNGTQPPLHPNNRGFDEFYGFTSGHWGHYFSPPLDHNGRHVRGNGFIVDDFTEHAMAFMQEHAEGPFFCYVPFNTPHSPMMVPDRFYAKFDGYAPRMRHYQPEKEDLAMTRAALALCENIDWNVGRILRKLDELHLSDDTIVVYFSDNGPNSWRFNGGMKGRKGSIDEGGLRSPCFVRWPGHIPAGLTVEPIAGAIDLLPTLADLSGARLRGSLPLDGRSLRPLLLDEDVPWAARELFSIKGQQVSVRSERFRLDARGRLFEVTRDPAQQHDVAAQFPDLAARLRRLGGAHRDAMQPLLAANQDRPFHVGYGPSTILPARDGVPHGTIERSSKAPNNSFFKHWTSSDDYITWDVDVGTSGDYDVIVYYTCAAGNEGVTLQMEMVGQSVIRARVVDVFDPPLYDKSKERVANSHYFVKDFKPLPAGTLRLRQGRGTLKLSAVDIRGEEVVDVHSIELHLR